MTKHALNAFLATSVTFINEIAALCEAPGADAKEVERGLKSEGRIGPRAYLSPGRGLRRRHAGARRPLPVASARQRHRATPLFEGVLASNDVHKRLAPRQGARLA